MNVYGRPPELKWGMRMEFERSSWLGVFTVFDFDIYFSGGNLHVDLVLFNFGAFTRIGKV